METLVNVDRPAVGTAVGNESAKSAVSWPAVFAGAVVAIATTVLLLWLGSGLGLVSTSPWPGSGLSAGKLATFAAAWLVAVQWISSGLGGYLTGRLRTKWVGTHTHEVFFRDTAHGFIAWALATVIVAVVAVSAAASAVDTGARAGAAVGSGIASGNAATQTSVSGYDVDTLFRSTRLEANASAGEARAETTRILAKGLTTGDVPPADRAYVAQLVAARTGISQQEAERRVDDAILKTRQAADAARKATAAASILTALSMLIGAFIACATAALGGHERDLHP